MIKIDTKKLRLAVMMGNAVMTKGLMIALSWYVGRKLDKRWGTEPYCMIGLVVLAMIFGVWYILYVAKKNNLTE
jgi:F0F1-type ATP synthase assembly protein I